MFLRAGAKPVCVCRRSASFAAAAALTALGHRRRDGVAGERLRRPERQEAGQEPGRARRGQRQTAVGQILDDVVRSGEAHAARPDHPRGTRSHYGDGLCTVVDVERHQGDDAPGIPAARRRARA
jgi:hypothetical protein